MIDDIGTLYVDKAAGTLADGLAAQGVALLAHRILTMQVEAQRGDTSACDIQFKDRGNYYELTLTPPISRRFVENFTGRIELAPLLVTLKNQSALNSPEAMHNNRRRVDYEEQKQVRAAYFEWRKGVTKVDDVPKDQQPAAPDLAWSVYRALNPGALPGYNNILQAWGKAMSYAPGATLRICLDLFSATPNPLDRAVQQWKALDKAHNLGIKTDTTSLQLFNPDQGKGQNRVKPDKLEMNNVSSFWMLEVLKAAGLYEGGITALVHGVKDRKTYVLAPRAISVTHTQNIMKTFKEAMQYSQTAIKFDVKAALEFCRAMLTYARADEPSSADFLALLEATHPRDIVDGFYTAFYKDLGNAATTMNVSHLRLPGWIMIKTREDIATNLEVLTEFDRVLQSIDEGHSDGITLLQALRDFVSGSELAQFFAFTTPYAGYLMQRRERNQFVHQLSTDAIRSVVMGTTPSLREILENEGFKNIAYAIRQSTVTAQYKKSKLNDRKYDVRYGLNQELARRSRYPKEFAAALADFLHKYNAENANVMETRTPPFRRNVRISDIDDIISLIDQHGSELIAHLLIAYGYASVGKEAQSSSPSDDMPAILNHESDDNATSEEE